MGNPARSADGGSTKKVIRQILGVWTAQVCLVGAQLIYTAISSRVIGEAGFARYAIALSVVGLLSALTSTWLTNASARRPTDDVQAERGLVTFGLAVGAAAFAAVMISAPRLAQFFGEAGADDMIRILAPVLLVAPYTGILSGYLRRRGSIGVISISQISVGVLAGVLSSVAVLLVREPWVLTLNTLIVAFGMAFVMGLFASRRAIPGRSLRGTRGDLMFAAKSMSFMAVSQYIVLAPIWVLGRYFPSEILAAFNRAQVVCRVPFDSASRGILTVVYPHFRRLNLGEDTRTSGTSFTVTIAWFGLVPLLGFALVSPDVVRTVLGPGWQIASEMAPFLWLAGGLGFYVVVLSGVLESANLMSLLRAPALAGVLVLTAGLTSAVMRESWFLLTIGVAASAAAAHLSQLVVAGLAGLVDLGTVLLWYLRALLVGSCLAGLGELLTAGGAGVPTTVAVLALSTVGLWMMSWRYRSRLHLLGWVTDGVR